MSKAFTKEDDSKPERSTRVRSLSGLPPGARNYMTADGVRLMENEIEELRDAEPERAADIQRILDSATVVKPSNEVPEKILFGTTVEVRDAKGPSRTFRIVGVDEIDFEPSHVSWLSTIRKSLLGAVVGQRVMLEADGAPTAFTIFRKAVRLSFPVHFFAPSGPCTSLCRECGVFLACGTSTRHSKNCPCHAGAPLASRAWDEVRFLREAARKFSSAR